MKTCIVVPCKLADKNLYDITLRFLDSIDKRTEYPYYEVLIYDNNSEPYLTERLIQQIRKFNNIDKFKISTLANYRFNLSQVYNWSLLHSNADLFVFCNNDMEIINNEWLTNIIMWFNTVPNMGICVPFQDPIGDPLKAVQENVLKDYGDRWFAMYAMRRNVIKEIGGFDERFDLYCHDHDIYCTVKNKGYKILWSHNSIVKHYGDRTTINHPKSKKYDLAKAYMLLEEKWQVRK